MSSHFCFNIFHFYTLFYLRISKHSLDINELNLTAVLGEKVVMERLKFKEMNGYKWEIAFLKYHILFRPYGKSPVFLLLSIPCAFKAIHSAGKTGKKCLQVFIYRQIGCSDNMRAEINRD